MNKKSEVLGLKGKLFLLVSGAIAAFAGLAFYSSKSINTLKEQV